jgi:hypothetical protein
MDALAAMRSSKEGQARAASADAEKAAMLAKKTGLSAPAPSTPMQNSPVSTLAQSQQIAGPKTAAMQQKAPQMAGPGMGLSGASALAQANQGSNFRPQQPARFGMNQSMGPMGGDGGAGAGGFKKGGKIKSKTTAKYSSGGATSKASTRGDGIAQRGKTKGRMI